MRETDRGSSVWNPWGLPKRYSLPAADEQNRTRGQELAFTGSIKTAKPSCALQLFLAPLDPPPVAEAAGNMSRFRTPHLLCTAIFVGLIAVSTALPRDGVPVRAAGPVARHPRAFFTRARIALRLRGGAESDDGDFTDSSDDIGPRQTNIRSYQRDSDEEMGGQSKTRHCCMPPDPAWTASCMPCPAPADHTAHGLRRAFVRQANRHRAQSRGTHPRRRCTLILRT